MHALIHLITKEKLSYEEIDELMDPYYEEKIFVYDKDKDEYVEPDVYPQFSWDYYRIHDEVLWEKVEDCYIIMDCLDKRSIVRKWWNGQKYIDQTERFESYIKENRPKWKGCYMYEIDIHW